MKRVMFSHIMAIFALLLSSVGMGFELGWPEIFDPELLLTYNLQLDPGDWEAVVNDPAIYDDNLESIEVGAYFWADGEEGQKIYVEVRRKAGDPVYSRDDGSYRPSLKIDINKFHEDDPADPDYPGHPDAVSEWHGMKKFSLENGDDNNALFEGLASNMHTLASGPEGYGHDAWRANWVRLNVNGHYYGVYVNAEHLDKQFMIHRDVYVWHQTWLYQTRGESDFTLEVGDDLNPKSPTVDALCYDPFVIGKRNSLLYPDGGECSAPSGGELVANLNEYVDMQSMLAMAAVNAFIANPDGLFAHARNSHYMDFDINDPAVARRRIYFPWDVDAAGQGGDFDIYYSNSSGYASLILGNPTFRAQYESIMTDLVNGPLSTASVLELINSVEVAVSDALVEDPYSKFPGTASGIAEVFDDTRGWFTTRVANVRAQLGLPPEGNDADNDGVQDSEDNCPTTYNPDQADSDGDGIGDECDVPFVDTDSDGIEDSADNCPETYNPAQADSDGDGIGDACDNHYYDPAECAKANMDGLGLVDHGDLAMLSAKWMVYKPRGKPMAEDLNGDRTINMFDLLIMASYWLESCQ
jgi:hypothetical protein